MNMRTNQLWLQSNGIPLSTTDLKSRVKSWNAEAWEKYLRWYEKPLKEYHLSAGTYQMICDGRSETIYREYGYETNPFLQEFCECLLKSLPQKHEEVLRLYYYEGVTERKIASLTKRSQPGVHYIKRTGLLRLKRETPEESLITLHTMRGLVSQNEIAPEINWIKVGQNPIRENRAYQPGQWKSELELIGNILVREAIRDLSKNQKQVIYLRFWCDQSISAISRQLGIALSNAQEICDSAASRIKRKAVELTQYSKEVSACV